jgi:CRP/FNR family transcriptional regulator, cyclic AMP receptor protein
VHNHSGERYQAPPRACRMNDAVPSDLDQFAVEMELPSRTLAFAENDPADAVYAVCAGKLRLLSTSREGRTAILRISGPGDFLGLSSVLNDETYQVTAETVAPTLLKKVQRVDFLALLQVSPEVSRRAAEVLARQCSDLIVDARRLALSSSVSARLARFLLEWDYSPRRGTQEFATAALTHEEIASMTGTSRETVTRLLKRFERDGVILRDGSSVVIANRESLYRIAG